MESLGPVERALDLGCGDGALTSSLHASSIAGADVSAVALEHARTALPEAELVQVELDGRLPFEDSAFDLVLCTETIEHVRDVQLFLSEARRVLRPRGELALSTPAHSLFVPMRTLQPLSPHIRFLSRRSLRRLLDGMGFDVVWLRRRGGTLFARAVRG